MLDINDETFDELVADALDSVPESLMKLMSNVVILVEDEPPSDEPDLLGLYDGIALTDRTTQYFGALPDRIFIFKGPILRMCESFDEVVDEVRITVVHEIAHHFGIDDARLHELGYE